MPTFVVELKAKFRVEIRTNEVAIFFLSKFTDPLTSVQGPPGVYRPCLRTTAVTFAKCAEGSRETPPPRANSNLAFQQLYTLTVDGPYSKDFAII